MNRIAAALCILALTAGFIGFHTLQILNLSRDIDALCGEIQKSYQQEDWADIQSRLDQLQNRWNKSRFWACLTIDTAQIEEIEISLRQTIEYAKLQAKENFIGEFIMFRMLAEHLPHQEGFSPETLL